MVSIELIAIEPAVMSVTVCSAVVPSKDSTALIDRAPEPRNVTVSDPAAVPRSYRSS
jgi:hypothetical protein